MGCIQELNIDRAGELILANLNFWVVRPDCGVWSQLGTCFGIIKYDSTNGLKKLIFNPAFHPSFKLASYKISKKLPCRS